MQRRVLLTSALRISVLGLAAQACRKSLSCTDTRELSQPDLLRRQSLEYTDVSPEGDAKSCATCKFYEPGSADQCGGCQLVAGPISPRGHCKMWAAS